MVEEFIFNEQGFSGLLVCNSENIDVADQSYVVALGERKNLIHQLGNKPRTSQLSFECSTN